MQYLLARVYLPAATRFSGRHVLTALVIPICVCISAYNSESLFIPEVPVISLTQASEAQKCEQMYEGGEHDTNTRA